MYTKLPNGANEMNPGGLKWMAEEVSPAIFVCANGRRK